ncbi:hypothetical protein [Actinophytocola oryzae]|uniref:Uncharacterized protein n=1 Tax=Actinophytocola oryzae TaxID=502181 RepID=A0A4R7VZD3_9PSEU|nr:hypothetical protein [Actinophytocola oryzae]TDV55145.1 hypothetical protein CLV71_103386 [Actinophytocola oryzae]
MAVEASARPRTSLPALAWAAFAAVPVVVMVVEVLRAPRLHFLDYWQIFSYVTTDDGSLDLAGLFTLHNHHPIVTPGLLFWLDAQLTGGSNIAVGLVDVVLAAVVVFGLCLMLPADLDRTKKAGLTVGFSALVFSSGALEMFGIGMSGASWLLGLAPAVFAVLCAHRGNTVAALVLGVLANLGHGTAFALWPALALVAWLRGDAWWRVLAPLVALLGLFAVWLTLPAPPSAAGPGGEYGFDSQLAAVAGALSPVRGSSSSSLALGVGGAVAVVLAGFVVLAVRERAEGPAVPRPDAGWVGVGTHMLGAAAMIGFSRLDFGPTIGLTTRYATLSALATSALLALVVLRKPVLPPTRVAVGVCVVAAVTYTAGSLAAVNVRNQYPNQALLGVAMRVHADDIVAVNRISPAFASLAERAGIYPFTPDFDMGCGVRQGSRPGGTLSTTLGAVDTTPVVGNTDLRGWALVDGHSADCVFVLDRAGRVVGGGYTGLPRPDIPGAVATTEQRSGWTAVAAPSTKDGEVVVWSDGRFYRLAS